MTGLHDNGTWQLIPFPSGKSVGCRWIFTVKCHLDGSVECYKACLVAKGYTQTYDIDYVETFSLVVKIAFVSILISFAANLD